MIKFKNPVTITMEFHHSEIRLPIHCKMVYIYIMTRKTNKQTTNNVACYQWSFLLVELLQSFLLPDWKTNTYTKSHCVLYMSRNLITVTNHIPCRGVKSHKKGLLCITVSGSDAPVQELQLHIFIVH